jgi:hypothetical protein
MGELRPSPESVASLREEACAAAERTVNEVIRVSQAEGLLHAERGVLVAEAGGSRIELPAPPLPLDMAVASHMAAALLQGVSVTLPPLSATDPLTLLVSVAADQGVPLVLVAGDARPFLRQLVSYELSSVQPFGIRTSVGDLLRLVFTRAFRHCVGLLDRVRARVPPALHGEADALGRLLAGAPTGAAAGSMPLTRALLRPSGSEFALEPALSAAPPSVGGGGGFGATPPAASSGPIASGPGTPMSPLSPLTAPPPLQQAAGAVGGSGMVPVRVSPLETPEQLKAVATAPPMSMQAASGGEGAGSGSGRGGGLMGVSPVDASSALLRTTTDPHLAARMREQHAEAQRFRQMQEEEQMQLQQQQQQLQRYGRSRSFRSEGDARSLVYTNSFGSSDHRSVVTIAGHEVRDLLGAAAPQMAHMSHMSQVPQMSQMSQGPPVRKVHRDSIPLSMDGSDLFSTIDEELRDQEDERRGDEPARGGRRLGYDGAPTYAVPAPLPSHYASPVFTAAPPALPPALPPAALSASPSRPPPGLGLPSSSHRDAPRDSFVVAASSASASTTPPRGPAYSEEDASLGAFTAAEVASARRPMMRNMSARSEDGGGTGSGGAFGGSFALGAGQGQGQGQGQTASQASHWPVAAAGAGETVGAAPGTGTSSRSTDPAHRDLHGHGVRFLPATARVRSSRDSGGGLAGGTAGVFSFEPSTASTASSGHSGHSSYSAHGHGGHGAATGGHAGQMGHAGPMGHMAPASTRSSGGGPLSETGSLSALLGELGPLTPSTGSRSGGTGTGSTSHTSHTSGGLGFGGDAGSTDVYLGLATRYRSGAAVALRLPAAHLSRTAAGDLPDREGADWHAHSAGVGAADAPDSQAAPPAQAPELSHLGSVGSAAHMDAHFSSPSLASTASGSRASMRGASDIDLLLRDAAAGAQPPAHIPRTRLQPPPPTAWYGGEDLGDIQHVEHDDEDSD